MSMFNQTISILELGVKIPYLLLPMSMIHVDILILICIGNRFLISISHLFKI
jgi:hypothetical protein